MPITQVEVRKPRKGDCGTCHWFERAPNEPRPGVPWSGICLYNPPQIGNAVVQSSLGGPPQAMMQGIHPPVSEIARCHHWTSQRQYYEKESHGIDSEKIQP
jgi:hypothetical protein